MNTIPVIASHPGSATQAENRRPAIGHNQEDETMTKSQLVKPHRWHLAAAALAVALMGLTTTFATTYDLGTSGNWTTNTTWNPNIAGGPTASDSIAVARDPRRRAVAASSTLPDFG